MLKVIDLAIQAFGAAGVSQETPLTTMYSNIRTLRLADGPDEVHHRSIAREELKRDRLKRWLIIRIIYKEVM